MNNSKKPSFFLVGAPKAGTTSVFHYLNEHPDIYIPAQKELNHFSAKQILEQKLYYENAVIIEEESEYLAHYAAALPTQTLGDASVSYLFYEGVPERIKAFNKHAKIIIMLREPVARAISHYRMDHNLGYIKETFGELLNAKLRDQWSLPIQQVFDLSLYYKQVQRYLNTFPRDRVFILLQEELSTNTETLVKELYAFLNVDNIHIPDISIKHNTYRTPSIRLLRMLYQNRTMKKAAEAMIPAKLKRLLGTTLLGEGIKQPIKQELIHQSRQFYADDVTKLSAMSGIDLKTSWKYT